MCLYLYLFNELLDELIFIFYLPTVFIGIIVLCIYRFIGFDAASADRLFFLL
jgi:hypothetical protein